jgi:signal transduction histidine kinase
MRTGRPTQSQDDAFVRRDGTSLPIAYTASPLTAGGEVTGAVVAFQDFSEHVRAERATRFLDEATRQLAQSIDWQETLQRVARLAVPFLGDWSLVVVLDPDGNPRSLAAEAADPARADAARALLEQYPIDLRARHGVGRILRTGAAELIEDADPSSFVDSDGSPTAVRGELLARLGLRSYMGAPLRAGGRVLGAIAFAVAEGPRRYGAEDLAVAEALAQRCAFAIENARLYRAAQEATRTREEVMAVVSHDLKTPLGAMLMGAAMVERLAPDGGEGEALRRAAATVRRTAERMRRLIRDLVDFAALEAGGISIRPAPADAAGLGREAVEVLAGLAEEGGVALRLEAAPAVPIVCDRDRVLQVLTNLIANALHVTEPGGSVTLRVEPGESEVVFAVADTGPGIAAEDLTRVFERWYRGPDVRYAGSGLGLAIARAIVEAHGGRIWAESEVRRGSTFCFAIPREPPPSPR